MNHSWYLNIEKAPEPSSADTILTVVAVFGTIFGEPDEKSKTKSSSFWKVDILSQMTQMTFREPSDDSQMTLNDSNDSTPPRTARISD